MDGGDFCEWFSLKNFLIVVAVLLLLSILSMPVCVDYVYESFMQQPNVHFVFYSMKNCGFCVPLRPIWKKLTDEFKKDKSITMKQFDTENNSGRIKADKITSFPTIRAILGGKVISTFSGERNEETIRTWILSTRNQAIKPKRK